MGRVGAYSGLLLGPCSGLVSGEFNSPEGLEALQAQGIAVDHAGRALTGPAGGPIYPDNPDNVRVGTL